MKNRLIIDLHENSHNEIRGRMNFPIDGVFCLEAMAEAVKQFGLNMGVHPVEVAADLYRLLMKEYSIGSKPPPTAGNG